MNVQGKPGWAKREGLEIAAGTPLQIPTVVEPCHVAWLERGMSGNEMPAGSFVRVHLPQAADPHP